MRLSIVVLLSLLAACNTSHQTAREIDMYNVSGDLVGTAVYTEQSEWIEHGCMHPDGVHLGDLQNVEADSAGLVDVELTAADATLLSGKKSLLPKEGSSLIIDEDPDDGLTQPSGDSGTRIICGVLKKDEEESSLETPTDPTETDIKNKEESE